MLGFVIRLWRKHLRCSTFDPDDFQQAIEFAKQELRFAQSDKSGITLKEHLESVWRQLGRKPSELENLIELPQSCLHVWKWFCDLHTSRSFNGFGPNPLNYTEIKNYFDLIDISPEEWELKLIKKFDMEAMDSISKEMKNNSQSK